MPDRQSNLRGAAIQQGCSYGVGTRPLPPVEAVLSQGNKTGEQLQRFSSDSITPSYQIGLTYSDYYVGSGSDTQYIFWRPAHLFDESGGAISSVDATQDSVTSHAEAPIDSFSSASAFIWADITVTPHTSFTLSGVATVTAKPGCYSCLPLAAVGINPGWPGGEYLAFNTHRGTESSPFSSTFINDADHEVRFQMNVSTWTYVPEPSAGALGILGLALLRPLSRLRGRPRSRCASAAP